MAKAKATEEDPARAFNFRLAVGTYRHEGPSPFALADWLSETLLAAGANHSYTGDIVNKDGYVLCQFQIDGYYFDVMVRRSPEDED